MVQCKKEEKPDLKNLPEPTVERLSLYRRFLLNELKENRQYIYSHHIAEKLNFTAVQVRRDFMIIGYSRQHRRGYDISEIIKYIGKILDPQSVQKVAVIGMGNLGRSISAYFGGRRSKFSITAAFDIEETKIDRVIAGVPCYNVNQLQKICVQENITLAILSMPPEDAQEIVNSLIATPVKGILNFTASQLKVPSTIFLEQYDVLTSFEKVAYFAKNIK